MPGRRNPPIDGGRDRWSLDEAAPLRRQVEHVVVTDACETEVHQRLAKRQPLAQGVAVAGEPQTLTQLVVGVLDRGITRHQDPLPSLLRSGDRRTMALLG